jgi:cellulose biosynthesis protein BcsQ
MGEKAVNCITHIRAGLDLICGDVRLNEFRSTDSLKKLKRALTGLDYDFCVIDTSPTYDNIIGNVLTASDILLIPVQQDIFSFQALQYQFEKLADLELDELDTHIVCGNVVPETSLRSRLMIIRGHTGTRLRICFWIMRYLSRSSIRTVFPEAVYTGNTSTWLLATDAITGLMTKPKRKSVMRRYRRSCGASCA